MSITKKLLPLSMVASLLIFTACGGGGDSTPKNETPSETKNVTVPQKISIVIPDALKNKRSADENIGKLSISKSQNSIESYGYQQLQSTISQAEERIEDVKENMKYLTLMMPDIVKACANTPENTKCTIPSGEIELTVEGKTFSMGEILYTQQDSTKKYQQIVVLDLKPTLEEMGETLEKDLETVKWSTDENHIETISDFKDNDGTFNMHLIYDKESYGKSTMHITDKYSFDNMQGNFTLKLNDKADSNNSVAVETSGTSKFGEESSDSFSSTGEVSDNGGYLISKGSFGSDEFVEKETFDNNGSLIKSSFCHTGDTCNMDEPNTWTNFDFEDGFVANFDDDDSFIDEFPEEDTASIFKSIELNINGGSLQDGFCDLLPPPFNSSNIEEGEGVSENSIGLIVKYESDISGVLFDSTYSDKLNNLKIICFYPTIEYGADARFVELTGNDRPTLTLKD